MTAFEALRLARAEDMVLTLHGDHLIWTANHLPPNELLTKIKSHRLEIIEVLVKLEQTWLANVARLLACSPDYLLAHQFVDACDLGEQHDTQPAFAAHLIRSHPRWRPPKKPEHTSGAHNDAPPHTFTALPNWHSLHDLYITHLMACRRCYAPTGHYCGTGAELRAQYNIAS